MGSGAAFRVKRLGACRLEALLTKVQELALMDVLCEGFLRRLNRAGASSGCQPSVERLYHYLTLFAVAADVAVLTPLTFLWAP